LKGAFDKQLSKIAYFVASPTCFKLHLIDLNHLKPTQNSFTELKKSIDKNGKV